MSINCTAVAAAMLLLTAPLSVRGITFDSSATGTVASDTGLCVPLTVSATQGMLIVGLAHDSTRTTTAITYGGTPLSLITSVARPPELQLELYGLALPPVGTHDVCATFSGNDYCVLTAASYDGVANLGAVAVNSAFALSVDVTLTTSSAASWVTGMGGVRALGANSAMSGGWTVRHNTSLNFDRSGVSFDRAPGAPGPQTATLIDSGTLLIAALELLPPGVDTPTITATPEPSVTPTPTNSPTRTLSPTVTPTKAPLCGDGALSVGEACDDGNTEDRGWCAADCLTITGPGPLLYGAGRDGSVHVLDVATQSVVATIPGVVDTDGDTIALELSPRGTLLAVFDTPTSLALIDTASHLVAGTVDLGDVAQSHDLRRDVLTFSPDGRSLFLSGDDAVVIEVDVAQRAVSRTFDLSAVSCPGDFGDIGELGALAVSSDGRMLYGATDREESKLVSIDLLSGAIGCMLYGPPDFSSDYPYTEQAHLVLSPDDRYAFSVFDGSLTWLARVSLTNGHFQRVTSEDYTPGIGLEMTCDGTALLATVAPGPSAIATIDPASLAHTIGDAIPSIEYEYNFTALSRDGDTLFWSYPGTPAFTWADVHTDVATAVGLPVEIDGVALLTRPALAGALCAPTAAAGCVEGFQSASLLVKESAVGREKLIAKFAKGPDVAQMDYGNPIRPPCGVTDYALCLYDGGGQLQGELTVDRAGERCSAGAAMCWHSVSQEPPLGKGYAFRDRDGTSDGVTQLRLRSGSGGKAKILLKAQNTSISNHLPTGVAAALAGSTSATMQLVSRDGRCFSAPLATVRRADGQVFKASR